MDFAGLKTAIAGWLKRSDLAGDIPGFVELAEARLARDLRLRSMVTSTTLTTVAAQDYVSVPGDLLEIDAITVTTSGLGEPLAAFTLPGLHRAYPSGISNGAPKVYAISGDRIILGPTPDDAYTVSLRYWARMAALSADADTNWLLTNHPGLYLWASLAEAEPFTENDQRLAVWEAKYQTERRALTLADEQSTWGPSLRIRRA